MHRIICLLAFLRLAISHTISFIIQDIEKHTAEYAARFANPMVAAQRGFVDDIIHPEDTRRILCNDLRVLRNKKMPEIHKKHSNIPL